ASAKVIPPVWVEGEDRSPKKWMLQEDSVKAMQEAFRQVITAQVSENGGYTIVDEVEPGTLEITVIVISLTPYAQRNEKVITKGSGELTMQFSLRDARSGKLIAIFEGQEQVGQEYQERSDFSAMKDLNKLFDSWGKRIRRAMDKSHEKQL
ncbi:DUF3313 family protein, partial [Pseudomaricurvus sp.]|uniref:DUF3313 family protein n=1 Tax=Pseudomaricurvus sp. TaxID=2004510 RepID=UPI003F6AAA20